MSRIEERGPRPEEPLPSVPRPDTVRWTPPEPQPPTAPQLLEQMPPLERAVFVLREAFGCDYADIAAAVGLSEAACRRLASAAAATRIDGTAPTWPDRVVGAEQVSRMLATVVPALVGVGVTMEHDHVLGSPGAVFKDRNHRTLSALALDILDGRIQTVRWVNERQHTSVGGER
ncbi:RNA polymerase sigma factor SigJ [Streptomyces sp. YIM 130001]|uniref:sigma factor-like helix-turn-helix DNA-binding protein n=1 Tax=Streptomyces sp. YIM 130001 TaxID=2259644 RepID=UPI000E65A1E9|nr:sigma factor-like helix-turn-helix DNA-binding protein [Streptomyces sp. YIM 130001]RII13454.1 RNA polymerase sigma factor SigJ [Streptomyces sp. YIM 130001]